MTKRSRLALFSILILFLFSGCVTGRRSSLGPGDFPPEFTLNDLSGRPVSLGDFNDKVILINFWASWCVPCLSELPSMERLYQRLKNKGFVIIAIGIDDEEIRLRSFKEKYGLTFPVLVDQAGRTKKFYGVSGVPESFLIGRDGRLIMIADLDDNKPVVRIVGPRDWDSPTAQGRISKLLEK